MKGVAGKPRVALRVALWGMRERERVAIQMTLEKLSGSRYTPGGEKAPAELGIVDIDYGEAEQIWSAFRRYHPGVPALVLSVRHSQQFEGAINLAKPFRIEDLLATLRRLETLDMSTRPRSPVVHKGGASTPVAPAAPVAKPKPPPEPQGASNPALSETGRFHTVSGRTAQSGVRTRAVSTQFDNETVQQCCGNAPDLAPLAWGQPESGAYFFDPNQFLLGVLRQAIRDSAAASLPVAINGFAAPIEILPGPPVMVFCPLKESTLRSFAITPIDADSLKTELLTGPRAHGEIRGEHADRLLWRVTLRTARGRLPVGIDPMRPVRLKRWPNFTRLLLTPHALRIAAAWVAAPASPVELAGALAIPQRFVFSLFSSAWAVGLMEMGDLHPAPAAGHAVHAAHGKRREKAKGGFLSRILSHLGIES